MNNLVSRADIVRHYALRVAAALAAVAIILFVIWLIMQINKNKYGV
jgi:hypothetical protein